MFLKTWLLTSEAGYRRLEIALPALALVLGWQAAGSHALTAKGPGK